MNFWKAVSVAGVLFLSGCSSEQEPAPGEVYTKLPTECFAGVEPVLENVMGELYAHRVLVQDKEPSTLPMHCAMEFEAGAQWRRAEVNYWLIAGSKRTSYALNAVRHLYENDRKEVPEAEQVPLGAGVEGFSWEPGKALMIDRNLLVEFTVLGRDRTGTDTVVEMSAREAREAAAALAEAQARNCSPILPC
ncbi:hypothetical protein ACOBQX_10585 [Actinokineospora sp. G85]|uniref:hypothetical protein n=1 Tax=Actinokineospora sp. G85 TaxID=3406626 RepID=UPI003C7825BA